MEESNMVSRFKILVAGILFCTIPVLVYAAQAPFREGDQGAEIASIQIKLAEKGYPITKADGKFTAETTKAVIGFQKKEKLKADGIIEEKTYFTLMGKNIKRNNESANEKAKQITDTALGFVGKPYKFGGSTPSGFDCSGFVQYVFAKKNITLPRTADTQFKIGKIVPKNKLGQGDLVFFSTYEPGASHCGIYLGQGKFIHASSHGVMVSQLEETYWKTRYIGARQVI